jgi:hypothetical protein
MAAVALCLFGAFFGLVVGGQRGGDTFFSNPWLAGTMTAGTAFAIAAGGAGLFSIVKKRDRSWTVLVTTGFGLLVLAYTVAEIAFPH